MWICVMGWFNELKHVSSVLLTGLKHVWNLKFLHARGLDVFCPFNCQGSCRFKCWLFKVICTHAASYGWISVGEAGVIFDVNDDAWASLWLPSPLYYSRHRMTKGSPQVTWQRSISSSLPVDDLALYMAGIWNGSFGGVEKCLCIKLAKL